MKRFYVIFVVQESLLVFNDVENIPHFQTRKTSILNQYDKIKFWLKEKLLQLLSKVIPLFLLLSFVQFIETFLSMNNLRLLEEKN